MGPELPFSFISANTVHVRANKAKHRIGRNHPRMEVLVGLSCSVSYPAFPRAGNSIIGREVWDPPSRKERAS